MVTTSNNVNTPNVVETKWRTSKNRVDLLLLAVVEEWYRCKRNNYEKYGL